MITAFLGTNFFASSILELLLKKNYIINYVLTKKDAKFGRGLKLQSYPVKKIAIKYKLNILEINSINSYNTSLFLKKKNIELVIVVEYGEKIQHNIINIPKMGFINIHPSLLPDLRGSTPIQHAIIKGYNKTGISLIQINEKLDAGNIFYKKICFIKPHDTYDSLSKKLGQISANIILFNIINIKQIKNIYITQNETEVSYACKLDKSFYKINWYVPAININRNIRSTYNIKKHFTKINNYFINIIETSVIKNFNNHFEQPGYIMNISKYGIDVITQKHILRIKKFQMVGKKIKNVIDFLNEKKKIFKIGDIFY